MKTVTGTSLENQSLPAFRITSIRERGFPTRTASQPTFIHLPAQLEGLAADFFTPGMVQVKYRGEWYLINRKALDSSSILRSEQAKPKVRTAGSATF